MTANMTFSCARLVSIFRFTAPPFYAPPPPPPPYFEQVKGFLSSNKPFTLAGVKRGLLSFLIGASFLVLTACAGGGGASGSGGNGENVRLSPLEVNLTFAPIPGGFEIGSQSDFGDIVSLNITAVSGTKYVDEDININEFSDGNYNFRGLDELSNYTFRIIGTLDDGRQQEVEIVFVWAENEEDYKSGGLRPGLDTDGDRRANSVDEDDDNDNILDLMDTGTVGDRECRLYEDCDDDGLGDNDSIEQQTNSNNVRCSLLVDCDGDTIRDIDEARVDCVIKADCDTDGAGDEDEIAGCVLDFDCDDDGTMDGADVDVDGDGLIEIGTHEELDAVRYALNGSGQKLSADGVFSTTGCGNGNDITSCSGYELVADISLADYADDEGGKGWRPLGHDTDSGTGGCQGAAFNGTFEGNGWTISDLNISRSGEDCVGLFGYIAADSEIRNLTIRGETVMGRSSVGGLVGWGDSARIVSSSVVMKELIGFRGVGGLVGNGQFARVHSSSVVVAEVRGFGRGEGDTLSRYISGLVGYGRDAQIHSSSVVAAVVSGHDEVAGLVGDAARTHMFSSSVVVGELSGSSSVGGLVGSGSLAQVHSSSVVVGQVDGSTVLGGLVGSSPSGKIAYSYVISGSDTKVLVGEGSGTGVASYWDSDTSGRNSGNHGTPQTTSDLRGPTGYTDIYADWDKDTNIFSDGNDEPLAVWCDRDHSGNITEGEKTIDNLIWDFGTSSQYPAIRCTPITPVEWRSWWSLVNDKPQLNQARLDNLLSPPN